MVQVWIWILSECVYVTWQTNHHEHSRNPWMKFMDYMLFLYKRKTMLTECKEHLFSLSVYTCLWERTGVIQYSRKGNTIYWYGVFNVTLTYALKSASFKASSRVLRLIVSKAQCCSYISKSSENCKKIIQELEWEK